MPPLRSAIIVIAQIIAGIAAAAAVKGLVPGDTIAFSVQLAPAVSTTQGLFLELFFTFELVLTILMLAAEVCRYFLYFSGPVTTDLDF